MTRKPNEETPSPIVPDTYVPPGGTRYPVHSRENWAIIAASHSIDPWDLIDFNFPGLKRMKLLDVQRATRQTNWYLREYVGCNTTTDGENWAFTTGLTGGRGSWKGGAIYIPPKPPELPVHRCSPTGGSSWRRPTFYRTLNQREQDLIRRVFGPTLPHWTTIGIGDGLGFGGQPWTDMVPMAYPQIPHMNFQINIGDAASSDLTSSTLTNCFVNDIPGTVAELLVHEMTHVWQYHNGQKLFGRLGVWVSSAASDPPGPNGRQRFTAGKPWNSYDVEQQASIVEEWYSNKEKKTDQLYPYIRLVIRAGRVDFPRDLSLNELNRDLADLRARGLD